VRAAGQVGASLQATLTITAGADDAALLRSLGADLKFVTITSAVTVVDGSELAVTVTPSTATKCERCWHYADDVGSHAEHPTLCGRCVSNLAEAAGTGNGRNPQGGLMAGKQISMWPWLAWPLAIVLVDQLTKWLILGNYRLGDSTYVTSFFNIVRAHNTGAAFSFLADAGGWQRWFFIGLSAVVSIFVLWMLRSHASQKLFSFALACILAGAIGNNLIDRVVHGYVVDFLDFHWSFLAGIFHGGHFPAFNVADIGRSPAGAVALILDEILRVRKSR
jgi:signal peptidase II